MGFVRLGLALAVVLFHSGLGGGAGPFAVYAFYVLSGFVIARVLAERYLLDERGISAFFANRVLRLAPVYVIVSVVTFALSLLADPLLPEQITRPLPFVSRAAVGNVAMFFNGLVPHIDGAFVPVPRLFTGFGWVPQYWTIGVEATFYALAPFVVRLVVAHRRWGAAIFLAATGVFYAVAVVLTTADYQTFLSFVYRNTLANMVFFAWGVLIYDLSRDLGDRRFPYGLATTIASVALMAIIASKFIQVPLNEAYSFVVWQMFVALAMVPILLSSEAPPRIARFDRYAGDLSYGAYVAQFIPIGSFMALYVALTSRACECLPGPLAGLPLYLFWIATTSSSVLLAIALHHWVERPVAALKVRPDRLSAGGQPADARNAT